MAVNELIGPRQATTPPHMCFFVLFQFTLGLRKKKKKYTFEKSTYADGWRGIHDTILN